MYSTTPQCPHFPCTSLKPLHPLGHIIFSFPAMLLFSHVLLHDPTIAFSIEFEQHKENISQLYDQPLWFPKFMLKITSGNWSECSNYE